VALGGLRYGGLVEAGWAAADRKAWPEAVEAFDRAVLLDSESFDGRYGLGYALVKSGRRTDAAEHLCAARDVASSRDRAEVEAVITGAGISCP
jgi:hypothetical protein